MFIKTERKIILTDSNVESFKLLPNGTYLTKYDKGNDEYYLELSDDFTLPIKIYGDSEELSNRFISSFNNSDKNLGILLTGLKGTGKSLTAKLTAIKSNIPIILVTEAFDGEVFKSFLNSIKQPVVIFIDEFEKVYNNTKVQNTLLSLLDGIFECKKLFIFTSNEVSNINSFMLNRPGRIRYLREYDSLSDLIIKEVIEDKLLDKSKSPELLDIIDTMGNISMDILVGLITEMNQYNESAREALKYLNIRPSESKYSVSVMSNGIKIGSTIINFHPFSLSYNTFEYYDNISNKWDEIDFRDKEYEIIRNGKEITIKESNIVLFFKPQTTLNTIF
jgi:hypothetical protein